MHLVGLIIRIYHDARSPESQIKKKARTYSLLIFKFAGFARHLMHYGNEKSNGTS